MVVLAKSYLLTAELTATATMATRKTNAANGQLEELQRQLQSVMAERDELRGALEDQARQVRAWKLEEEAWKLEEENESANMRAGREEEEKQRHIEEQKKRTRARMALEEEEESRAIQEALREKSEESEARARARTAHAKAHLQNLGLAMNYLTKAKGKAITHAKTRAAAHAEDRKKRADDEAQVTTLRLTPHTDTAYNA